MRIQTIILALFLLSGVARAANNEKPTTGETRISLNGTWNFKADFYNSGENKQWFTESFDDAGWDKMIVPGNWDLRNEYANFIGKGWYRTTFETPSELAQKVVRLYFEAVGIDYKVWLNGEPIADVTGGFFAHYIDVTKKLKTDNKNTLVVCADNTFRSGAYWSWGGIRRPVALVVNNQIFAESAHILAIPDLKKGTADVSVTTHLVNSIQSDQKVSVTYELSFAGKAVKRGELAVALSGSNCQKVNLEFALPKKEVKLWHFDSPNLYSLRLQLNSGDKVLHVLNERFGIRKVQVADGQFLLNGEPVRAMGLNWVADDRLTGNTLPADIYKRDIDQMKTLGCNLTRLSHLPLPNDVYDYLDERGMLIIAEIPLWGTTNLTDPENPIAGNWMKKLVNDNFNHPSIIGWCVGNEIGEKNRNPKVMEYGQKAIKFVKDSLDRSRLVVLVSHTANYQEQDPSQYGDFVPYNTYGTWGKNVDRVHGYQPDKLIFVSEFGANLIGEDLNSSTGDFGKIMNELRGRKYLFGGALWTYNDYRSFHRSSDPSWDSKVSQNRDWGVVDGYGNKKRAFELIRKEFAPLRSMTVQQNHQEAVLNVTLQPRSPLDLPAFILHNYQLICEDFGPNGELLNKTTQQLPAVKPGDEVFVRSFAVGEKSSYRKVSLVTPANYTVMDTTIYYQVPEQPKIKAVFNTGDKVRVVFDPVDRATEYKVVYGDGSVLSESAPTIDNFIELPKLDAAIRKARRVNIQLVAINGAGESRSNVQPELLNEFSVFPPVIKAVKPLRNGIGIGFSSSKTEYLYKIEYSGSPDFSSDVHAIQTTSRAACFIPELQEGKTYYVRVCAVEQYEIQSPWSETWCVKL